MPKVSIVIPTRNHAKTLGAAIESCLNQTHYNLEVIVVDDASDDRTQADVVWRDDPRVVYHRFAEHLGVSQARNMGTAMSKGEFIMFLDADDTLEPTKLERQLKALASYPDHEWVLCDVRIHDLATGQSVLASERYDYASKELSGWIYPLLRDGNFIPIMSSLLRRSILLEHGIIFDERRSPEDYHFWSDVAKVARVRYVPEVLATYNKSKTGRNQTVPIWRRWNRTHTPPLRLNLGCGAQGTRSWNPLPGFINLDKSMEWTFEGGLGDFVDESVAGISISHALMYVPKAKWHYIFAEFYRVLKPGGVIRITEDETLDLASARVGGWKGSDPAITLTWVSAMSNWLEVVGFEPHEVGPKETLYEDGSLVQQHHGDPPDVFFIEGVKRA